MIRRLGGEMIRRLGGGTAQGETGKDAEPHKYCFPFSVHAVSLLSVFGKQHHIEEPSRSREQSEQQRGEKQGGKRSILYSDQADPFLVYGIANFAWVYMVMPPQPCSS